MMHVPMGFAEILDVIRDKSSPFPRVSKDGGQTTPLSGRKCGFAACGMGFAREAAGSQNSGSTARLVAHLKICVRSTSELCIGSCGTYLVLERKSQIQ